MLKYTVATTKYVKLNWSKMGDNFVEMVNIVKCNELKYYLHSHTLIRLHHFLQNLNHLYLQP